MRCNSHLTSPQYRPSQKTTHPPSSSSHMGQTIPASLPLRNKRTQWKVTYPREAHSRESIRTASSHGKVKHCACTARLLTAGQVSGGSPQKDLESCHSVSSTCQPLRPPSTLLHTAEAAIRAWSRASPGGISCVQPLLGFHPQFVLPSLLFNR